MQTTEKWQPTAQQLRFHQALRDLGCFITGEQVDTQLHHCAGASCRHNKVWIGQWWVLVLRRDLHDNRAAVGMNITDHKNRFEQFYGDQRNQYWRQINMLVGAIALGQVKLDLADLPPPEVLHAIQEYTR